MFCCAVEYLKDEFDLDELMEDEIFCYKFAGHLKNLLMRLRSGYSAKNMLTESIRESCPLTFECAIGIADIIEQEYGLQMDMSETAYLALHIGDRLESRLEEKEKILDDAKATFLVVKAYKTVEEGKYVAWEQDAVVEITEFGGDTKGVNIPNTLHWVGDRTYGTFDPKTKAFTADGAAA